MIYYFDCGIIGRSSGRSSVGAAAYRSGEKLCSRSVGSAAYLSGDDLRDKNGDIVHDYTRKGGVVHSEIILPKCAPSEFKDRETLWNAVEAVERRRDAQLAREIVVALQREFDLKEQIELLREFIQVNFVDKGMIADFSVHDKGDGNQHSHIMLITCAVAPDGFGLKNTDWNRKNVFVEWRKSWAEINNRMFERKGLDVRIDHRSYKAQGIDREPMIHLGYEASALERKSIKTEKGDINREIQKRNAEREAKKTAQNRETVETMPKAMVDSALNTAEYLNELKEGYFSFEKSLNELKLQRNEIREELPRLTYRTEQIDEYVRNIEALYGRLAELQETRRNLKLSQWSKKQKTDEAIKHAEYELKKAELFFKNRFYIEPREALEEIKRINEQIRAKESDLNTKNAALLEIMNAQDVIELKYHTTKLLAEIRPDKKEISRLLEKLSNPPDKIRDKLLYEQIDRRLNIIPDHSFRKAIETMPPHQAQTLTNIRQQHKERQHLKELVCSSKNRTHSFTRSR
ncbi:MAG: MobA/MobL family protein [Nitrososphaerota archaeon]|nr:MobA/MobL family protein [Nitrososphaerota archaeon]